MTSHYDVLGISRDAAPEEIKRAYYRKARRFHPDGHVGATPRVRNQTARAMAGVNVAWDVLGDVERRRAYDRLLDADAHVDAHARREGSGASGVPATTRRSTATRAGGRLAPGADRERWARARAQARADDRVAEKPRAITIGTGFRPYLGGLGHGMPGPDGERRISLSVEDRADFASLGALRGGRLYALHAARARVSDADLGHLAGMVGLGVLDLSCTGVSDAGMVHVGALPNLEVLQLWDTTITDRGLELLASCTSLRVLGLGGTAVTDRGLAVLARFRRLRVLQLFGTPVRGPGLRHLDGLGELELVSLPWRTKGRDRRRLLRTHPGLALT